MDLLPMGSSRGTMPLRPRPSVPLRAARPLLLLLLGITVHTLAAGATQCSISDLSDVHACETLDLTNASLSLEQLSALADANFVQKLKLDGVMLGPSGARTLAEALKSMPKLTSLSVSSCSLSTAGAAILLAGLPPSLASLKLRHNILGDEAMRTLAVVLQASEPLLQELDLSWNGITARGVRTVADALQNNSALERLWLDWNGIKDRGARALGDALPYINKLKALHLEHNAIKTSGAMALTSGLRRNSALQYISLAHNGVDSEALRAVEAALRAQPAADETPPPKAAPLPSVTDDSDDLEEISFDDDETDEASGAAGRDEL